MHSGSKLHILLVFYCDGPKHTCQGDGLPDRELSLTCVMMFLSDRSLHGEVFRALLVSRLQKAAASHGSSLVPQRQKDGRRRDLQAVDGRLHHRLAHDVTE